MAFDSSDYKLLEFSTHKEYVASFARTEDHRYLQNSKLVKQIVQLGFRTKAGKVLSHDEFDDRKKLLKERLAPKVIETKLYCKYFTGKDPVLRELAVREAPNVVQLISTIIFLQVRQRNGFYISGYIDYENSLRQASMHMPGATNWRGIFEQRILLRPKPTDLSFYDWHKNYVSYSDNDNYRVAHRPKQGILFFHKGDHKMIPASSKLCEFSHNVERKMIYSDIYGYVVFYDHLVRKKK
ncbi:cilia- and flagella-associated protein 299-like [Scaptodrosophila lebanonensis]|uniref:Cilia- and flagella-associated protein 299 n=1 Tax=Drosophila lebanonensis TaxID=7225 RepID=A0A6J2TMI2_DROLE|nr:cilia- and flagella-associated protein 299-like [Scaptodrosophila lebanonensis]